MSHTRKEYEFWLERIRNGHDAFIAEQELDSGEADRTLLAANVLIAWSHLSSPDCPRDIQRMLTDDDRRVVRIARGINEKVVGKPS